MSIALMTAAWQTDMPASRKIVLLALCDNANDQGECYPSIVTIARKCSMTDRAVYKCLRDLEASGYIEREARCGRSNIYNITNPSTWFTPERRSQVPLNDVHPTPEQCSPPPLNNVHPTPERRSPPPERRSPITITKPSNEPSPVTPSSEYERPSPVRYTHTRAQKRATLGVAELVSLSVPQQIAEDWLRVRQQKRLPLTHTALRAIQNEAHRAGMTLAQAIERAAAEGWAGFKASWLSSQPQHRRSIHDERAATIAALTGRDQRRTIDITPVAESVD